MSGLAQGAPRGRQLPRHSARSDQGIDIRLCSSRDAGSPGLIGSFDDIFMTFLFADLTICVCHLRLLYFDDSSGDERVKVARSSKSLRGNRCRHCFYCRCHSTPGPKFSVHSKSPLGTALIIDKLIRAIFEYVLDAIPRCCPIIHLLDNLALQVTAIAM